ncbi:aminotransferase class I/II-fold pyridoxal phosphate-dependent enzyme [Halopenitus persicus]|uniref:Aminotransferase n=1 Tax=Halopenitus persicus TaxID=1048396 RepID=A0A1H3G8F4_9EURY|nr:aminotransferase class I/II-fold pyridoxal phosphate-dependent enzyme [Halopenitus persicus]SDX99320.1 L-threonine O-3-phosphate decarboxylase [Halopenitus persicus]
MDREALARTDRVPHGGVSDRSVVDFSANTNPESPAGVTPVYDAARAAARRYPSDDYAEFRTAAGEYLDCDPQRVIPTAGALAGIRLVCALAVDPGDRVLLPEPSFGEYAREVRLQGGTPEFVPHDAVLDADPAGYALAIVCTPNNPTGELLPRCDREAFAARCRAADTPLLVDEAFLDFTDASSLAPQPGVVVARSLTKVFGLPGLRAGFLVATGEWRDALETARPAWGLSTPAAAVGAHCLGQAAFLERTRERVASERDRMADRLASRFTVRPSDAPFLLVDVSAADVSTADVSTVNGADVDAEDRVDTEDRADADVDGVDALLANARAAGYALRDARTFRTLESHVRIAVRRPAENDGVLEALDV